MGLLKINSGLYLFSDRHVHLGLLGGRGTGAGPDTLGAVLDVISQSWGGYSGPSHRLGQFPPNSDILQKLQRTELICRESNIRGEYRGHTGALQQ